MTPPITSNNFIPAARIALADPTLQEAFTTGLRGVRANRLAAMNAFGAAHREALRQQGAAAKRHALSRLPELLEQAETRFRENGAEVLWAVDGAQAGQYVLEIAARHGVRLVVKSKSMLTEEIGLNHMMEQAGIETLETDLGEYIVQIEGGTPSHIVAPIMHKTKDSVRDLLIEKLDMPTTDVAEEMTKFVRGVLRPGFINADMGISGGNFVIAETGTVCLVTNEGNGRLSTGAPKVHIALVGIEKIVATLEDYAALVQLLARSSTGQQVSVYMQLINGPRRADEPDGPEHVYVIFVDNGRSQIYQTPYAEALACLRCGACLNNCPVYQSVGGHAYGSVYPGPIGSVLTPLLNGIENAAPLPYASSLCGQCKEVCPVDIDLPRMLLDLRRDLSARGKDGRVWALGLKGWALLMASPALYRIGGKLAALATRLLPIRSLPGPLSGWTAHRVMPRFAAKSFREQWNDRQKEARDAR